MCLERLSPLRTKRSMVEAISTTAANAKIIITDLSILYLPSSYNIQKALYGKEDYPNGSFACDKAVSEVFIPPSGIA
jgi:hypothetical protein